MEATKRLHQRLATRPPTNYTAAYQLLQVMKIPLAFVAIRPEEAEGG